MPNTQLCDLHDFPKEAVLVGHILSGYGEIEFAMYFCVQHAISNVDEAFRFIYKNRGEKHRIDNAKNVTHKYEELGLGEEFSKTTMAFDYLREIRNQYAHCIWVKTIGNGLCFSEMEELTKFPDQIVDFSWLTQFQISEELLQKQFRFAQEVKLGFNWLNFELRLRRSEVPINLYRQPNFLEYPQKWDRQIDP